MGPDTTSPALTRWGFFVVQIKEEDKSMGFFGINKIWFSADRTVFSRWDKGTGRLNFYVNNILSAFLTENGFNAVASIGAAAATAGAATLAALAGKVTSEALTTAQNAIYTLTITNSLVAAGDIVQASVANGSNTQGTPMIGKVTPGAGSVVIEVINKHATAQALNGTVVVSFTVTKA